MNDIDNEISQYLLEVFRSQYFYNKLYVINCY